MRSHGGNLGEPGNLGSMPADIFFGLKVVGMQVFYILNFHIFWFPLLCKFTVNHRVLPLQLLQAAALCCRSYPMQEH